MQKDKQSPDRMQPAIQATNQGQSKQGESLRNQIVNGKAPCNVNNKNIYLAEKIQQNQEQEAAALIRIQATPGMAVAAGVSNCVQADNSAFEVKYDEANPQVSLLHHHPQVQSIDLHDKKERQKLIEAIIVAQQAAQMRSEPLSIKSEGIVRFAKVPDFAEIRSSNLMVMSKGSIRRDWFANCKCIELKRQICTCTNSGNGSGVAQGQMSDGIGKVNIQITAPQNADTIISGQLNLDTCQIVGNEKPSFKQKLPKSLQCGVGQLAEANIINPNQIDVQQKGGSNNHNTLQHHSRLSKFTNPIEIGSISQQNNVGTISAAAAVAGTAANDGSYQASTQFNIIGGGGTCNNNMDSQQHLKSKTIQGVSIGVNRVIEIIEEKSCIEERSPGGASASASKRNKSQSPKKKSQSRGKADQSRGGAATTGTDVNFKAAVKKNQEKEKDSDFRLLDVNKNFAEQFSFSVAGCGVAAIEERINENRFGIPQPIPPQQQWMHYVRKGETVEVADHAQSETNKLVKHSLLPQVLKAQAGNESYNNKSPTSCGGRHSFSNDNKFKLSKKLTRSLGIFMMSVERVGEIEVIQQLIYATPTIFLLSNRGKSLLWTQQKLLASRLMTLIMTVKSNVVKSIPKMLGLISKTPQNRLSRVSLPAGAIVPNSIVTHWAMIEIVIRIVSVRMIAYLPMDAWNIFRVVLLSLLFYPLQFRHLLHLFIALRNPGTPTHAKTATKTSKKQSTRNMTIVKQTNGPKSGATTPKRGASNQVPQRKEDFVSVPSNSFLLQVQTGVYQGIGGAKEDQNKLQKMRRHSAMIDPRKDASSMKNQIRLIKGANATTNNEKFTDGDKRPQNYKHSSKELSFTVGGMRTPVDTSQGKPYEANKSHSATVKDTSGTKAGGGEFLEIRNRSPRKNAAVGAVLGQGALALAVQKSNDNNILKQILKQQEKSGFSIQKGDKSQEGLTISKQSSSNQMLINTNASAAAAIFGKHKVYEKGSKTSFANIFKDEESKSSQLLLDKNESSLLFSTINNQTPAPQFRGGFSNIQKSTIQNPSTFKNKTANNISHNSALNIVGTRPRGESNRIPKNQEIEQTDSFECDTPKNRSFSNINSRNGVSIGAPGNNSQTQQKSLFSPAGIPQSGLNNQGPQQQLAGTPISNKKEHTIFGVAKQNIMSGFSQTQFGGRNDSFFKQDQSQMHLMPSGSAMGNLGNGGGSVNISQIENSNKSMRLQVANVDVVSNTPSSLKSQMQSFSKSFKAGGGYPGMFFSDQELSIAYYAEIQDSLNILQTLPRQEPMSNFMKLSDKPQTIVFDLDETLIKAMNEPARFPQGVYDVKSKLNIETLPKKDIYISFRPYLFEMLTTLKKNFEIILFTAGHDLYAETIVKELEKEQKFFDYVITRECCTPHPKGRYQVKDLIQLLDNRNIKDIIIVDNRATSFAIHFTNGIPIKDYEGDKTDRYLQALTPYLLSFQQENDVRRKIKHDFKLDKFVNRRSQMRQRLQSSHSFVHQQQMVPPSHNILHFGGGTGAGASHGNFAATMLNQTTTKSGVLGVLSTGGLHGVGAATATKSKKSNKLLLKYQQ